METFCKVVFLTICLGIIIVFCSVETEAKKRNQESSDEESSADYDDEKGFKNVKNGTKVGDGETKKKKKEKSAEDDDDDDEHGKNKNGGGGKKNKDKDRTDDKVGCKCEKKKRVVCGSDGVKYRNRCLMKCFSDRKNVQTAAMSTCEEKKFKLPRIDPRSLLGILGQRSVNREP